MTRAQSICFVLALAVAPMLSSCSVRSLPSTTADAPATGALELAKPRLTGNWKGKWDTLSASGTFTMHLTQKGKKFSGTVAITIESVTTKGTISKSKLTLVVTAKGLGTGKGTAQVNKARTTIQGSVTIKGTKSSFSG